VFTVLYQWIRLNGVINNLKKLAQVFHKSENPGGVAGRQEHENRFSADVIMVGFHPLKRLLLITTIFYFSNEKI
jgi:hypothetical protein